MTLRVVQIDGEPWFVAPDACNALDLAGSPSKHTARLGGDEKRVLEKSAAQDVGLLELFQDRLPRITLISESGLYKLIMRSKKPEAKPFQEWVTRDVMPSIRKTGSYVATAITFCMASNAAFNLASPPPYTRSPTPPRE